MARGAFSSSVANALAFYAASIRLQLKTSGYIEGESFQQLIAPHIENALWKGRRFNLNDSLNFDVTEEWFQHYITFDWLWESKPHLLEFLDLATIVRRLIPRLVGRFNHCLLY